MSKRNPIEKMSLEELRAEEAELADQRTLLRERQRAVEERIQVETALAPLSAELRAKLAGTIGTGGSH